MYSVNAGYELRLRGLVLIPLSSGHVFSLLWLATWAKPDWS